MKCPACGSDVRFACSVIAHLPAVVDSSGVADLADADWSPDELNVELENPQGPYECPACSAMFWEFPPTMEGILD